jgi:hypothetical protein
MMSPIVPVFAQLSSTQEMILCVLGISIGIPCVIAVVGIWAGAWAKVHKLQLETGLKQQMVDRGMSAEDIVAIVKSRRPGEGAVDAPCASEVVVDIGGEWQTALILKRDGDRCFVHLVGTEMSDNQWVTSDRIRIPATSEGQCGSPLDWSFPAGTFAAGDWCGRSARSKPEPVDQDI